MRVPDMKDLLIHVERVLADSEEALNQDGNQNSEFVKFYNANKREFRQVTVDINKEQQLFKASHDAMAADMAKMRSELDYIAEEQRKMEIRKQERLERLERERLQREGRQ